MGVLKIFCRLAMRQQICLLFHPISLELEENCYQVFLPRVNRPILTSFQILKFIAAVLDLELATLIDNKFISSYSRIG